MYAIRCEGDFQDAERGIIRKVWAASDENGTPALFKTFKSATAFLEELSKPIYSGIENYNILSHNQITGYPPRVVRIQKRIDSSGYARYPYWYS